MMKNEKAQVRVLEAFLAVLLVFSAFVVSATLFIVPEESGGEELDSLGMQVLLALDKEGLLGRFIDEGNWTGLRESLKALLPPAVLFNLTVYSESMQKLNTTPISNQAVKSSQVTCIEYVCASRNLNFRYYILRLQLAMAK
jgi:hypothetical protein